MASLTKPRPRVKASRSHYYYPPLSGCTAGLLCIEQGGKTDGYHVTPLPSAWGRAFHVEKFGAEPGGEEGNYDVLLDGPESACGCKGFLRWGHCRHVEVLQALVDAGQL